MDIAMHRFDVPSDPACGSRKVTGPAPVSAESNSQRFCVSTLNNSAGVSKLMKAPCGRPPSKARSTRALASSRDETSKVMVRMSLLWHHSFVMAHLPVNRAHRHRRSTEEEVREPPGNARAEDGARIPLGSRLAARFAKVGLREDIEELRGQPVRPASFES